MIPSLSLWYRLYYTTYILQLSPPRCCCSHSHVTCHHWQLSLLCGYPILVTKMPYAFYLHLATFSCTVPFRLIRPVTRHRACGLALILVNITRHIDFGRMWEMVQKKKLKVLVPFHRKNLSKLVEKSVCHGSHRKWSECRNATAVSQVTPLAESIKMVQYCFTCMLYIGARWLSKITP